MRISTLVALVGLVLCSCTRDDEPATTPSASGMPATSPTGSASGMPLADIRIDAREPRHFAVDDDSVIQALALAHAGRLPVTRVEDGYRLDAAPAGSVVRRAGLESGDIVLAVNKIPILDPAILVNAYPELRDKRELVLTVRRSGQPIELRYDVRPSRFRMTSDRRSIAAPSATGPEGEGVYPGIESVGPRTYEVSQAAVDDIVTNASKRLRRTRLVPHSQDGVRIFGIRKNDVAHALGLQNGDVLRTVNGYSLADPENVLDAYMKLRKAKVLKLAIERRATPITLEYRVVP